MPSSIQAQIYKVATGGPYTYTITQDGVGVKVAVGLATAGAAFNAARDDMVALIPAGEDVKRIVQNVVTGP